MNTFVSHPSVRIKGTENNFNPVQCIDPDCTTKNIHMHCPFCTKSEWYTDPVILRAHYRVKHVDKGVEFAGLKILRCCDSCDIVGVIKGEKKFKGAHWHCYRCRNGFNRRDEAIKHYKTHFRNPQTTFQIQIAHEVNNQNLGPYTSAEVIAGPDEFPCLPGLLTEQVVSTSNSAGLHSIEGLSDPSQRSRSSSDNEVQVSVAANETVEEGHTIMIIEEHLDNHETSTRTISYNGEEVQSLQYSILLNEKERYEKQCEELEQRTVQLEIEKSQLEQDMRAEMDQLKLQISMQSEEIVSYQKREQELLNQLTVPLEKKVAELVSNLQDQYSELLNTQLAQVRRAYLSQLENGTNDAEQSTNINLMEENVQCEIQDNEQNFVVDVTNVSDANNEDPQNIHNLACSSANNELLFMEASTGLRQKRKVADDFEIEVSVKKEKINSTE